jgi:hypothetical protein
MGTTRILFEDGLGRGVVKTKAHFIYSKNEQACDLDFLYKGIGTKKELTLLYYTPSQEAKGEMEETSG